MDLFIYPLFLGRTLFPFRNNASLFPLVISLAVFEKFRSLAYTFFKLYAAVYMLVPAFFLVNVFVNALYTEINTNFLDNLFGTDVGQGFFAPVVQLGSVGFIVFLKFKLYKRATSLHSDCLPANSIKMKTPYKNIYAVLKLNRFIVLAVVIFAMLSSTFSLWMAFKTNKEALNSAFAINTDGSIIPLKLVTQKENFKVEALAHLDLFHNYFYNIDASNYERNLEKALWLAIVLWIISTARKKRMVFTTDCFNIPCSKSTEHRFTNRRTKRNYSLSERYHF